MPWIAAWLAAKRIGASAPWQAWVACIVIVVIGVGLAWERHKGRQEGAERAIQMIEEGNRASERKADKGSDKVAACARDGFDWDRDRGVCDRSRPGR